MKKNNPVNDWVRGGSPGSRLSSIQLDTILRGAGKQKAAMVLPDRTAAT